MIKVTINGETKQLQENITIEQMLKELGYDNRWMGVAVNTTFISKNRHGKTTIKEGDEIEILSPMSGG